MTEQTQPTDAEILDAADDFRSQYKHGGTTFDDFAALDFARAVLAKWGTPAPVGVEPVASVHRDTLAMLNSGQVRPWDDSARLYPASKARFDAAFVGVHTTPQPTQPQAGAALDEAGRRAGAAERELASCREDLARLTRVRDQMKEQWGVDRKVSFDVVWADALRLKQQAGAVPLTDEQIGSLACVDGLANIEVPALQWLVREVEYLHGIKGGQHGTKT